MTLRRYDRLLAMILSLAIVAGVSACKRKKETSEISISESTEASTSESETTTTTESATESTSEVTTETVVLPTPVPSESDLPSETVPSETTSAPAETTAAPADPTKAPDKPKTTKEPKATSTPTATPTTKPTDTPTPTTAPKSKDPGLRKSKAISAAKAAVQDYCGSHSGFEFNDTVMSNQQARAKACANNHTFYGHNEVSGTFKCSLEAASQMSGYIFEDGSELYVWSDDYGTEHKYTDFYSFVYDSVKYGVTQHTENLSADGNMKYFGVGFSGYSEEHDGVIYYTYYTYVGADDDFCRPSHGY